MQKLEVVEFDTLKEVKSRRCKCSCLFSISVIITIVVGSLVFGIYQAVVHLGTSAKSEQTQQEQSCIEWQSSSCGASGIKLKGSRSTMRLKGLPSTAIQTENSDGTERNTIDYTPISFSLNMPLSTASQMKKSEGIVIQSSSAITPSPTINGIKRSTIIEKKTIAVLSWSRWLGWSSCSTFCGGGVQTRMRICSNPKGIPNDLVVCYGKASQKRNCSEWKCPDCSKVCTTGKLNSACDTCICTNNTFSGRVVNKDGVPLDNVTIAFVEFPFNILARTDVAGFFKVQGICVSKEEFVLERIGYSSKKANSTQTIPTKSTMDVTLAEIVYPDVVVHPETKLRFVGDYVTFCCKGDAKPNPQYEWILNGRSAEEFQHDDQDGSKLVIPQLTTNMSGKVRCRAYNDYGAKFSNDATIKVLDRIPDSCNSTPFQNLTPLPHGCIHLDTNSTAIDLGECSKVKCIAQTLTQTNNCTDKNYCCKPKTEELIQIQCASVIYINLTRITSCGCDECLSEISTIRGVAASADGTPFRFGYILSGEGKHLGRTGRQGTFSFTVPFGITRLIVTFKDLHGYNNFYDHTKVIPFEFGRETFVNVRMRSRPQPIIFNATEGFEIPLGGNNSRPPTAAIYMAPQSLMTADGKIYNGTAKATVDFFDPRNESELREADGDFTAVNEDGEQALLETFGVMKIDFKDEKGRQLEPNRHVDVLLDLQENNLTIDEAKAVKLWFMDEKTGSWRVMDSMLQKQKSRYKRSDRILFFFGSIDRDKIHYLVNLDVLANLCIIKVNATKKNRNIDGAILTVAVTRSIGNQYIDYTLKNGGGCIQTFCTEIKATLQISSNGKYLTPSKGELSEDVIKNHSIEIYDDDTSSNRFINRITMKRISKNSMPPFYSSLNECENSIDSGFIFKTNSVHDQQFNNVLTFSKIGLNGWYQNLPGKVQICFLMIGIKDRTNCKNSAMPYFHVESFNDEMVSFGYTIVSPYNETFVCAEYSCPIRSGKNVVVKVTSLTGTVRIIKLNDGLLNNGSGGAVRKKSTFVKGNYYFEFAPKLVSIPDSGIISSDKKTYDKVDLKDVKKNYIKEHCKSESLTAAVEFECM